MHEANDITEERAWALAFSPPGMTANSYIWIPIKAVYQRKTGLSFHSVPALTPEYPRL